MSEMFQRLNKSFFQEPKELVDLLNKGNFIHKYLPKQMDIDKILKIIQRKVLKGTYLPIKIKEIQEGYLCSLYFKDLYLYLSQNKPPSSKPAIRKWKHFQKDMLCWIPYCSKSTWIRRQQC